MMANTAASLQIFVAIADKGQMNVEKIIARAFRMSDETWQRHVNPMSGWTRVPVLPLLAISIWSRIWIGAWCLVPIAALIVWTVVNPRAFPPPAGTEAWMSRAVLGERIWLDRVTHPIPAHHANAARALSIVATLGLLPLAYGLYVLDAGLTVAGTSVTVLAKMWFLDRMVWLHADMARDTE